MSTTKLTLAQKVANLNTPLTWDNIQNKPPFGTEANTILVELYKTLDKK